ncbi:MAG: 3-deoxy-7-phosphoheptulonate synthase [Bacillota bacterium]|nr:3-deoxy-7-phosphoheptulonate synthase [Bacillota bacterium]MDW7683049.1 3-deoxy-7-phosphoheptulonate synthase [Bacillota bacterium]
MIVVMDLRVGEKELAAVEKILTEYGYRSHLIRGEERLVIGAVGAQKGEIPPGLETLPGVEKVLRISQPFKLAGREVKPDDTVVEAGRIRLGGGYFSVIAGPCAVESREQLSLSADIVRQGGGAGLRGGAFKPRTSPYAFQGLMAEGLNYLRQAREATGLSIVTEVVNPADVEMVADTADVIQIGARNMQNFPLLNEVGQLRKPVLLKRGLSATVEEWLMAAEYIMSGGNYQVILCERGIRTFETYTRNTLDVSAIALAKRLSHLPVVADPSHAGGHWRLVRPLALASLAAGADGLLIEVHPEPARALCDGPQSLTPEHFQELMQDISRMLPVVGKSLWTGEEQK